MRPRRDLLNGRVVVITGASSGIGRANAIAFAREGAAVTLAGRRSDPLDELANHCRSLGVRALTVPTDVTDAAAVERLADAAATHLGG